METQKEIVNEKRKRKIISQPVLVRSVKPSGAVSADYTRPHHTNSVWKAA